MCAGSGHRQALGLPFRGSMVCGWKPDPLGELRGLREAGNEAWLSLAIEGHVLGHGVLPPQASALWYS